MSTAERDEEMKRPKGSNADEWNMFLKYWLNGSDIAPFLAVQVAEAIEEAVAAETKYLRTIIEMSAQRRLQESRK